MAKRILIINYEFPPLGGGGGVASYDLAVEWAKTAQVDVLTSAYQNLSHYEKIENINVHRVKVLGRKSRDAASFISMLTYLINGFFKGLKLCRQNKYDVINTHFAVPSGPLGYLLGKIFKIKNVLSLHGGDIYDPSKDLSPHKNVIFRNVVKFILNKADVLIAQSSNTKANAEKYYHPKKEIGIIPLAFHEPIFEKKTRAELHLAEDKFYLIMIGRIVKRKALDLLIKALAEVEQKDIELLIVGDGPEADNLKTLSEEKNISTRVHFLGFVENEEKYQYLNVADCFTLTSLHEGFGIVFMEAMYSGLPIICTNHGGQIDFLEQEENALLFNVGDQQACTEAIEKLFVDQKLYQKMIANNKEKVKNFYANKIAAEYLKVFTALK